MQKVLLGKKHPKPQGLGCYIFNYKPQLSGRKITLRGTGKVTACARVQVSLGTKVVSVTPVVIFSDRPQDGVVVNAAVGHVAKRICCVLCKLQGEPAARYRKVTI